VGLFPHRPQRRLTHRVRHGVERALLPALRGSHPHRHSDRHLDQHARRYLHPHPHRDFPLRQPLRIRPFDHGRLAGLLRRHPGPPLRFGQPRYRDTPLGPRKLEWLQPRARRHLRRCRGRSGRPPRPIRGRDPRSRDRVVRVGDRRHPPHPRVLLVGDPLQWRKFLRLLRLILLRGGFYRGCRMGCFPLHPVGLRQREL